MDAKHRTASTDSAPAQSSCLAPSETRSPTESWDCKSPSAESGDAAFEFVSESVPLVVVESIADYERRVADADAGAAAAGFAAQRGDRRAAPFAVERKVELNQRALDLFRRFPRKLRIIGITGKARQGKTTLALLLLRKLGCEIPRDISKLFQSAGGANVVTSGIWMWGAPIPVPGTDEYVVLLDTEGTDRGNDTLTAQLTSITCFLSSLLVLHVNDFPSNNELRLLTFMMTALQFDRSASVVFPKLMVVSRSISIDWLHREALVDAANDAALDGTNDDGDDDDDLDVLAHVDFDQHPHDFQRRCDEILNRYMFSTETLHDNFDKERKLLREVFPNRSYALSVTADNRDTAVLKQTAQRPIPVLRDAKKSAFSRSINMVLRRMIDESPVKHFGDVVLEPTYLVRQLQFFFGNIRSGRFEVPSLLVALHSQQADDLITEYKARYYDMMGTIDDVQSESELRPRHDTTRSALLDGFELALRERKINDNVVQLAKAKLTHALDAAYASDFYMPLQIRVQETLKRSFDEVKAQQARDAAELVAQQARLDGITAQQQRSEEDLQRARQQAQEAQNQIAAANQRIASMQSQIESTRSSGGGGGFCIIL